VPTELAKWVKATDPRTGQRVSFPGLVRRRAAEGALWLADAAGDPFRGSADMPQRVVADDPRSQRRVNARAGLRLRSGPGLEHEVLRVLPFGTRLFVERQIGEWCAADLEGDGAVDGYVHGDFLDAAQDSIA
jgi:lysozyme